MKVSPSLLTVTSKLGRCLVWLEFLTKRKKLHPKKKKLTWNPDNEVPEEEIHFGNLFFQVPAVSLRGSIIFGGWWICFYQIRSDSCREWTKKPSHLSWGVITSDDQPQWFREGGPRWVRCRICNLFVCDFLCGDDFFSGPKVWKCFFWACSSQQLPQEIT